MSDFDRSALRERMRAVRRALGARERIRTAEAVAAVLRTEISAFSTGGKIAGYWACDGEVSLHPLFAGALTFQYLLPQLAPGKHLRFAAWRPGDPIQTNRYGIPEPDVPVEACVAPKDLDVVLLPLLAFDRDGHRLGSGGGYYDRSFAFLNAMPQPSRPVLVGIAHAFQEVPALQTQAWDVGLDAVVTERGWLTCR